MSHNFQIGELVYAKWGYSEYLALILKIDFGGAKVLFLSDIEDKRIRRVFLISWTRMRRIKNGKENFKKQSSIKR